MNLFGDNHGDLEAGEIPSARVQRGRRPSVIAAFGRIRCRPCVVWSQGVAAWELHRNAARRRSHISIF